MEEAAEKEYAAPENLLKDPASSSGELGPGDEDPKGDEEAELGRYRENHGTGTGYGGCVQICDEDTDCVAFMWDRDDDDCTTFVPYNGFGQGSDGG